MSMKVQFDRATLYQINVFASDDSWRFFPQWLIINSSALREKLLIGSIVIICN